VRFREVADGVLDGQAARIIAVVPDPENHYPRAVKGEVGLLEGWTLGQMVNEAIQEDRDKPVKRAIVAIIDVPSQAYGRREEAFGIPSGHWLPLPEPMPTPVWPVIRSSA